MNDRTQDLTRATEAVVRGVMENLRGAGPSRTNPQTETPAVSFHPDGCLCVSCTEELCLMLGTILDNGADRVSCRLGSRQIESDLAPYIDHTALRPETTADQIRTLCEEAVRCGFASVCINPCWVPFAADLLGGCRVPVCSVVGFPLGATTPTAKAFETREAVRSGASEIDMVINIGKLKGKNYRAVADDIRAVVDGSGAAQVKVILETALLTDEEKVVASAICREAAADFVKTSTGFSTAGATVEDIVLIRRTIGQDMRIKAAGGIRTRAAARALISAGADRLGASASVKMVSEP